MNSQTKHPAPREVDPVNEGYSAYDDFQLIQATARDRDQNALAEIFRRHEKAAYNLALRIIHRSDLAEDLVQEAMLAVWQSAGTYRQTGAVRSWVLRIVALMGLRKTRDRLRESSRVAKRGESEKTFESLTLDGSVEQGESISALRQAIGTLPPTDQQLLALHFGGGMTFADIGNALDTPSTTVSYRLKKTVEKLRAYLSKSGFASTGLFTVDGELSDALLSGARVPTGLREKLTSAARKLDQAAPPTSSWAFPTIMVRSVGWTLSFLLAAVATLWISSFEFSTEVDESAPLESSKVMKPFPSRRFPAHWNFQKRSPINLVPIKGRWRWEKGFKHEASWTEGGMGVAEDCELRVPLPLKIPSRPMVVELHFHAPKGVLNGRLKTWNWVATAQWNFNGKSKYSRLFKNRNAEIAPTGARFQAFFFDRFVVEIIDRDEGYFVWKYTKPFPSQEILLIFKNIVIERMEVREIERQELPALLRDPEALASSLNTAYVYSHTTPDSPGK